MSGRIIPFLLLAGATVLSPAAAIAKDAPASAPLAGAVSGPVSEDTRALDAAWDKFSGTLAELAAFLRSHPDYRDAENRPGAYSYLASLLISRLEEDVIFDPDYPYFRVLDHRIREGGDNPDQRYLMSAIRGGETYRIWGTVGKERRLDFQIYAGDPFVPNGGRAASFLSSDKLKVDKDGKFEVWVSPDPHAGNWLENPADGNQILVRQIFSDWNNETPGDVHIDRHGYEGALKPPLTEKEMASRLRKAADNLNRRVRIWPQVVTAKYMNMPANTLRQPEDVGAFGGVPGRFMVAGNFDLQPDEALVVRVWPMSGNYQGIQLADLWFSSLEYANRQSSLTGDQSQKSADGSYYYVISREDPGVPNWVDTVGRQRGAILLRFDGMKEKTFDPKRYPVATRVKLSRLRQFLPGDTPTISPEARRSKIAERRKAVQLRFDD